MKDYLRHDGFRYKRVGPADGGPPPGGTWDASHYDRFIAYGWACSKTRNEIDDVRVGIWFRPGVGYFAVK